MKDASERTSTLHADAAAKPAASLADVKIRRPGEKPGVGRDAKPGDLTSILAERRDEAQASGAAPETDDARPDEASAIQDPIDAETSDPDPAETGAPVADDEIEETHADALSDASSPPVIEEDHEDDATGDDEATGDIEPPADRNGSRQTSDGDASHTSHPPTLNAEPEPAEPPVSPPVATEAELETSQADEEAPAMATEAALSAHETESRVRDQAKTLRERLMAQRGAANGSEAEAPQEPPSTLAEDDAQDPAQAEAAVPAPVSAATPETPSAPSDERDDRIEDEEDSDRDFGSPAEIVTDALLRKRMAAVLLSESKRREEREAKQSEKAQTESAAEEPETPAEPPPAEPAPKWSPPAKPIDIVRYWTLARRGRRLPALSDLDLGEIARNWPDSLLLRYVSDTGLLELEKSLSRLSSAGSAQPDGPEKKIDYTPDVIDWVVHQGLVVTKDGNPVRATDEFDVEDGVARYRVVALPLGEDGSEIDHVLCHLEPE